MDGINKPEPSTVSYLGIDNSEFALIVFSLPCRYGGTHLMTDLLKEPSGLFENFCRMSAQDFEYLLQKIEPYISKKDTKWRKAIPAKERLAVTLRFLATGDSFKSLHYLFKISPQLLSYIIPEVCRALIKEVGNSIKVIKVYSTVQLFID